MHSGQLSYIFSPGDLFLQEIMLNGLGKGWGKWGSSEAVAQRRKTISA